MDTLNLSAGDGREKVCLFDGVWIAYRPLDWTVAFKEMEER